MKTAAVYIRVSTDGQMEQSPESQLAEIRKFAARSDYLIPDEYIFAEQDGISGRSAEKRPEFQRMIGVAKSKDKPFDVILVWKFSRFARNRQDSIIYKRLLRKQLGIEVVSVNENIGTDNDGLSELIEAMIEAMDEYYSLNLAEEVKRGMTNKIQRGEPITGAPMGYTMVNSRYIVDPETAPIVKMMFDDFAVNGLTTYTLTRKLNDMGIFTRAGRKFSSVVVRYMLTNPVYVGKLRWSKDTSTELIEEGVHEAIIEPDIWEKAQKRDAEIRRLHKPKEKGSNPSLMLSGIVRCGKCGSTLCKQNEKSYNCGGYSKGICRISHSILREKLDGYVIDAIDKMLEGGDFELAPPLELPKVKSEAEVIVAQIKKQEQKLERIKEAYEAGVYDVSEMKKRLAKEQAVLDELLAVTEQRKKPDTAERKKKLMSQRMNIVQALRSEEVTTDEKNALLRTFVDRIVFTRERPRMPGTIDIFLR
jgi:DNA invertase Pin-like site-specific DNA recombinase